MQKRKLYSLLLFVVVVLGIVGVFQGSQFAVIGAISSAASALALALLTLRDSKPLRQAFAQDASENVPQQTVDRRVAELEGLYSTLQANYTRKTAELQDKIDDLERFHRLAIGRELRLIELKNEIERLHAAQDQPATGSSA